MSVISWLRLLGTKLDPEAAASDPSRVAQVTAPPLRSRRATRGRHQAASRRRSRRPVRRLRSEVFETRNLLSLLVSSTEDSGPGSLREAIDMANSSAGPDEIRFSLPVGSVIQALTALPPLSDTSGGATIDGDVNGDHRPDIIIRGTGTFDLVFIRSSDNVVRNLVIQNGWAGIHIYGIGSAADRNQVLGCYLGTNLTGMEVTGTANGGSGVWVGGIAHGTIIGGPGAYEGNIIAGSGYHGIQLIDAPRGQHDWRDGTRIRKRDRGKRPGWDCDPAVRGEGQRGARQLHRHERRRRYGPRQPPHGRVRPGWRIRQHSRPWWPPTSTARGRR